MVTLYETETINVTRSSQGTQWHNGKPRPHPGSVSIQIQTTMSGAVFDKNEHEVLTLLKEIEEKMKIIQTFN